MTDRVRLNELFGNPVTEKARFETNNMVVWNCQAEFPELPFKKMYVNAHILPKLQVTFKALAEKNLLSEIKSFGGCWNVRPIRGYKDLLSIHSWALAVDFNTTDNPLGFSREKAIEKGLTPFSEDFFTVWRLTGWVCGIDFSREDGMHFQWTYEFEVQK